MNEKAGDEYLTHVSTAEHERPERPLCAKERPGLTSHNRVLKEGILSAAAGYF